MSTGIGMLKLARQHIGEKYANVLVPKNNPNWRGPWDRAEFMSWLVFQDSGILYGCINNNSNPATADAYTGSWQADSLTRGTRISVSQAAGTPGAILLRFPPEPGAMGHIVLSDGTGGTVEAKGVQFGVVEDTIHGRRWDTGVLIPGIFYGQTDTIEIADLTVVYHIGRQNLDPDVVTTIQIALAQSGFDPGPVDGIYGNKTAAAVAAFQQIEGLVVDGEVGVQTASALHIRIT